MFDESISTKVSLPRVLDQLLADKEDPGIIISFLDDHREDIVDILAFSTCSPRLLSLEFIRKLNLSQVLYFSDMTYSILMEHRPMATLVKYEIFNMVWQVLVSKRALDTVKELFRRHTEQPWASIDMPHPYRRRVGLAVQTLEAPLLDEDTPEGLAFEVNELDNDDFDFYCKNLTSHGLLCGRLLQDDVFGNIDPVKQYFLMKEIPFQDTPISMDHHYKYGIQTTKGIKRIMCGDMDVEVRKMSLETSLKLNLDWIKLQPDICEVLDYLEVEEASEVGASKIIMKAMLGGCERYFDWILFFILNIRGPEFMARAIAGNKLVFEKYFDIIDVLKTYAQ